MQEQRVAAGALRLNVAISGPSGRRPLLVLHGVTRRWQDFLTILPPLAASWETHVFDLRGHGLSDRAPDSAAYRVRHYADDITAYVESALRDRGPVFVLGHSLGSMVASAVAARLPDRVAGLVLEDPTFEMTASRMGETSFPDLFRAFRLIAGSDRSVDELSAELAEQPVRVPGRDQPVRLGDVRDACSLRFSAACLKRLDPAVLSGVIDGGWLEGYDVPGTLAAIRCPTLMLAGDFTAGGALPADYASELAGRIPNCTLAAMPGVGHNIHASQPESMLRLVLPFLASID